jgi:hypothetical protein
MLKQHAEHSGVKSRRSKQHHQQRSLPQTLQLTVQMRCSARFAGLCASNCGTLLPQNDVMMSANEFHEQGGEREVFEELDDAEFSR